MPPTAPFGQGQTSAAVLRSAFERGVSLYCNPHLHAKVLVVSGVAVVSSANLSRSSGETLQELGIISDDPAIVGGAIQFIGSAQESERSAILRGLLKNDELCPGRGHPLRFEQQVAEVCIAAAAAQQGFDVTVDGFDYSKRNLGAAVIENAIEVIEQHLCQLFERSQPLPTELVNPLLEITKHRPFVAVEPQPIQALFERVSLEQPPIHREQAV
jgi:phosphatidylserine/phosphatidylglycerophosphate/cardiolipin synthase-like enzyme